jgi:hypothetical protein
MKTQIELLQLAANGIGLVIKEWYNEDKRKKVPMFFATSNGTTVSPVLNYPNLNHFLLGWHKAIKHTNQ